MGRNNSLFYLQLSKQHQQYLLQAGEVITLQGKKTLFKEGDLGEYIYIILSGQLRLAQTHPMNINKRFLLEHFYCYEVLGYELLFHSTTHTVTAETVELTSLLQIPKLIFEEMLSTNSEIRTSFLSWINQRANKYPFMYRDMLHSNIKESLFSVLIRFCSTKGVKTEKGITIQQKLSNVDLADYVGGTRESLNRILQDLEQRGILSIKKKIITIHDYAFLRKHLHCTVCPNEQFLL